MSKGNVKIILAIRHGERIDATEDYLKQRLPRWDPELTEVGIQQAKDVASQVLRTISINDFEEVNIFCSPFMRTLMTAVHFVNEITKENNKIKRNYYKVFGLSEFLNDQNFLEDPLPHVASLHLDNKSNLENYEDLVLRYIKTGGDFVDFPDEVIKEIPYPEVFYPMCRRYQNTSQSIYDFIMKKDSDKSTLSIIVSHAYGVEVFAETVQAMIPDNKNEHVKFPEYCGTYAFKITDNKDIEKFGDYKAEYKLVYNK